MGAWIFQGNPRRFPVDDYLRHHDGHILWTVKPPSRVMDAGDRAFVWRADGGRPGPGGVVAIGRVASAPAPGPDDAPDLWGDPASAPLDPSEHRVRIDLEEVRLTRREGMLPRSELLRHPVLSRLGILKFAAVFYSPVSLDQERAMMDLWGSRGAHGTATPVR